MTKLLPRFISAAKRLPDIPGEYFWQDGDTEIGVMNAWQGVDGIMRSDPIHGYWLEGAQDIPIATDTLEPEFQAQESDEFPGKALENLRQRKPVEDLSGLITPPENL